VNTGAMGEGVGTVGLTECQRDENQSLEISIGVRLTMLIGVSARREPGISIGVTSRRSMLMVNQSDLIFDRVHRSGWTVHR
jgi:hypothetical protein